MPKRNAPIPLCATLTLPCGCEVRDAAWYGRLTLTGVAHCPEAAVHVAAMRAAAAAETALGVPPSAENAAAARQCAVDAHRALAALYDHVEAQRPKIDDGVAAP